MAGPEWGSFGLTEGGPAAARGPPGAAPLPPRPPRARRPGGGSSRRPRARMAAGLRVQRLLGRDPAQRGGPASAGGWEGGEGPRGTKSKCPSVDGAQPERRASRSCGRPNLMQSPPHTLGSVPSPTIQTSKLRLREPEGQVQAPQPVSARGESARPTSVRAQDVQGAAREARPAGLPPGSHAAEQPTERGPSAGGFPAAPEGLEVRVCL